LRQRLSNQSPEFKHRWERFSITSIGRKGDGSKTEERSTLSDYEEALVILAAILIGAIAIRILFDRA
jgi:hypothetical protein